MPVACQSCAPECPQAFGAQRLRGLNVTVLTTSPSFARDARKCHLPLHRGGFGASRYFLLYGFINIFAYTAKI